MQHANIRAFVAGATGYTGQAVVAQLCAAGVDTIAHVRPTSPRLAHWRAHFSQLGAKVDTTPWEAPAMAATLREAQPQVVFALLGTTAARQRRARAAGAEAAEQQSYERVDYGLTVMLLAAAEVCGASPRFVYLSSAGAGAGAGAGSAYLQTRWRVEERVRASALPWTIARPSFITGPDREEDRPGERIGAGLTDLGLGALAMVGLKGLRDRYASMTSTVLARGLVHYALADVGRRAVLGAEALRAPHVAR